MSGRSYAKVLISRENQNTVKRVASQGRKERKVFMKKALLIVALLLVVSPVMATVTITAVNEGTYLTTGLSGDANRSATIRVGYTTTDVNVRAFALDINIDSGCNFWNIRDFNVGENNASHVGYGIFPGRFRDFVNAATPDVCYANTTNYNPLTPYADPGTTNTGIGYGTVIVEMGYLGAGDSNMPAKSGTLFRIDVNGYAATDANLTVTADTLRGGVVSKDTNATTTDTNLPFTTKVVFGSSCVTIPTLTDMTKAQADAAITAVNLVPNGAGSVSCTGTYNYVLTQDTGCVASGSTVNYTYETGKTVTSEVGATVAAAQAVWVGQGFSNGTGTAVVNCSYVGLVISHDTGCKAQGTAINYTYGIQATEPNIVGKTMTDANAALIAAGITASPTITYEANGLKTALTVDRSTPKSGNLTCTTSYVVDTNCLYVGRVFTDPCMTNFTVTAAMVTLWNGVGRPNCWCCTSQKRGNGYYTGSSATKTDSLDLAQVKNATNWTKTITAANACLDFNLSGKIDSVDLAKIKSAANWTKVTGAGPPCQ